MSTKQEVKKLKITAVNLRSVLTDKSKQLEKLGDRKKILVRKQRLQAERAAAEKDVEATESKKGPIRSVLGNVGGMVMSIKDRIMNFFGYLLMGFVVDKLPQIMAFLKSAYEKIEPFLKITWKVISTIAKALWKFGGWVSQLWKPKQAEKNVAALEGAKDGIEKEIDSIPDLEEGQEESSDAQPKPDGAITPMNFKGVDEDTSAEQRELLEDEAALDAESSIAEDPAEGEETNNPVLDSLIGIDPGKIVQNAGQGDAKNNITQSDDAVSKNIDAAARDVIHKVKRSTGDLKGNTDGDMETIVIPIEVEKVVDRSSAQGGGGSPERPEPVLAGGTSNEARIP